MSALQNEDRELSARVARQIESYWHGLGYEHTKVWVEPVQKISGGHFIYQIRSNLVNGLPPLEATRQAA